MQIEATENILPMKARWAHLFDIRQVEAELRIVFAEYNTYATDSDSAEGGSGEVFRGLNRLKLMLCIQGGPKIAQFLYALTWSNINPFSKLFYCQNQEKICNTITKDPTVP